MYGRARMKSAHGTAENIGCSITTNGKAVQPAVARRLTGRAGSLSVITDFQTHAAKLPRQAGTALFECRREVLLQGNRRNRVSAGADNQKRGVTWNRTI